MATQSLVRPATERLRAESRTLRASLFRIELDLAETMAQFAAWDGSGSTLRQCCERTAHKGYRLLESLASKNCLLELAMDPVLAPRLERLRTTMARLSGGDQEAPKPANTVLEPAPQPLSSGQEGGQGLGVLSKREREVLKNVAEGQSTKQVAATLGITFKTASCHRQRVMQKLGIHDTAGLVRFAIRYGLVTP